MKLTQLRYVLEVYRRNNHISDAADALHTSQPGVSKQIRQLEHELGFQIFERRRNRVIGLTEPGREVIQTAERIVNDMETLRQIKGDYDCAQSGVLNIATTHTHARYILPPTINRFMQEYPDVQVNLQQGNPTDVCVSVQEGRADLAIGTEAMRHFPDLSRFPCFKIKRCVVARKDHPILALDEITLEDIAKYPLITHDLYRSGRWRVMEAFERHGLSPKIIFGSVDTDVSKTYIELGVGIAILASQAVDPNRDTMLGARDASHLFESSTSFISVRKNAYLRRFAYDFIQMVSPSLDMNTVKKALGKLSSEI